MKGWHGSETVLTPRACSFCSASCTGGIGERVLGHRVGRGQPLALAQRQLRDVVHERHDRVLDRQADVERVVVGLVGRRVEHGRRAAGALDERVAVVSRHRRRGRGQQRRERAEGQVHVVVVDQRLVVGDDLVRRAVVIQDRQLHLCGPGCRRGRSRPLPTACSPAGRPRRRPGSRRWRESDAPIVIGPVSAGALALALGLLLPPLLHAARAPMASATAPMAMAFLEDQGRLHLIGSLTFEGGYTGRFRGEPGAESSHSLTIRARSRGRPRELLPRR